MITQSTAIIPAGETEQDGFLRLREDVLVGISMPAGWDAASLNFQASIRATKGGEPVGTWLTCTDADGANIDVVVAADAFVLLSPNAFQGVEFLKLVASAQQSADREITCILTRRDM